MRRLLQPRVRYIPQLELTECGAAALAMVLDFHGCATPLVEVRSACGVSRDGSSAARILRAAREYGLDARGLRLEPRDLAKLPLPAILHWEFNHFVVLERIGRRGALLVDPALGRRQVSWETLSQSYTGVVLAFEKTEAVVARPRRSGSLARYLSVLSAQQRGVLFVAFAALMLEILSVLSPAAIQVTIDHVIKPQRDAWLLPVALAMVVVALARHVLQWLRDRVLIGLQTALDLTLVGDFVQHLMKLPLAFFEQRNAGDLMQRVDANGELRALSAMIAMAFLDALMLIAYAALMLAYDLRLGLLVLSVSLSRLVLAQLLRQGIKQRSANLLSLAGREHGAMVEALASPEMMRALGAETLLRTRYGARVSERMNAELAVKHTVNALGSTMTVFDGAAAALVLWLGGARVLDGQMTIGVFAGFLALQALVDKPLNALLQCVDRYLYAQAILQRVDDVLETQPEARGTRKLATMRGELSFERVSFRHGPTAPLLFDELSFRIAPGEKVALVGRSGQGKSTIMKLLLGVLHPVSGRIAIDGVDLRELDKEALAAQLGVVLQESFLLDDSIEQNLRLRVADATARELERAAEIACIHDTIDLLPAGYRTHVGPQGTRLSGGQRQRIAIARAVVREPRLLLLDEATSSLDLETEARLHENLSQLGCTRLLIAHRLATVVDADRILVLEAGKIVQEGGYSELAAQPGLFRSMLESLAS